MTKSLLVGIVVALAIAVVSTPSALGATRSTPTPRYSYPSEYRYSFVAGCTAYSSNAYCRCTLRYLQRRVPYWRVLELEDAYAMTGVMPRAMKNAYYACAYLG